VEPKTKVAIVGCGNISDVYFKNCLEFGLDVVACTDMDMTRAEAKKFDVGAYYLTTLVSMLGPVRWLTGSARISFPERLITSQPLAGTKIKVNTPTHVTGVLDFVSGPVVTVIASFDVWAANLPRIEIYGSEGSLSMPDPNTFGGPVQLKSAEDEEWRDVPLARGHTENSRGLGVRDMAAAIRENRPHRANGEMAFHVLDLMQSFEEASISGKHIEIQSRCERPEAL